MAHILNCFVLNACNVRRSLEKPARSPQPQILLQFACNRPTGVFRMLHVVFCSLMCYSKVLHLMSYAWVSSSCPKLMLCVVRNCYTRVLPSWVVLMSRRLMWSYNLCPSRRICLRCLCLMTYGVCQTSHIIEGVLNVQEHPKSHNNLQRISADGDDPAPEGHVQVGHKQMHY